MSSQPVTEKVLELAQPLLTDLGFELVEVEFKREGRGWVLRFFIDKPGGVTLDDCAAFSREASMLLDVEDVIEQAYSLEVSSPGLDRPLKKPQDFERFRGEHIKIKTYEKLDPDGRGQLRKTFSGELLGFAEGRVGLRQLDKKGGEIAIELKDIALAHLDPQFD